MDSPAFLWALLGLGRSSLFFLVFPAQVSFSKPLYMEGGEFQMQHVTCDTPESFHYPHFADEKTRGSDLENSLT